MSLEHGKKKFTVRARDVEHAVSIAEKNGIEVHSVNASAVATPTENPVSGESRKANANRPIYWGLAGFALVMLAGLGIVMAKSLFERGEATTANTSSPVVVDVNDPSTLSGLDESQWKLAAVSSGEEEQTGSAFPFVTSREKMIRFAFARMLHADYRDGKGARITHHEYTKYARLGEVNHAHSSDENGNEIQARLSVDDSGKNFIVIRNKSSAATLNFVTNAAVSSSDILTWAGQDLIYAASVAFNELESAREKEPETYFHGGVSKSYSKPVGSGTATFQLSINEQSEADSYGAPWSSVTVDWDWQAN